MLQRLGSVLDEAGAAWSVVHEESGPQIDDVTLHVPPADRLTWNDFATVGPSTGVTLPT